MRFLQRLAETGRRIDRTVAERTGAGRLAAAIKTQTPEGLRKAIARYGSIVAVIGAVLLFAFALSDSRTSTVGTTESTAGEGLAPGAQQDNEGLQPAAPTESVGGPGTASAPSAAKAKEIAKQFVAPPTAGVCGKGEILDTGSVIQFPYAVQCHTTKFTGDNGGDRYRGVYRDKIRVAMFLTDDVTLSALVKAGDGCGESTCTEDYIRAYADWFQKYYETWGRKIELVPFKSTGTDADPEAAIRDARAIAGLKPPVFAVLGGYQQASPSFSAELKAHGIMCFCGTSPGQNVFDARAPFMWGGLMSSHQAYLHRSEYVGKRLGGQKAIYAGDAPTKDKTREFGFIWFDNTARDYEPGALFYIQQLKKYGVNLKPEATVRYENIAGCQNNADAMVDKLKQANVTSVTMAVDPLCPIYVTNSAQKQLLPWEWIVLGSAYTDTNVFGRLYNPAQWSRAFGVSMNPPAVTDQNSYWYKMFYEVRPRGDRNGDPPKTEAPVVLFGPTKFFTGVHLAGPDLNPNTFKEAMAKAVVKGGTPTIPRYSYGPRTVGDYSFWDYTSYDDMTEIWWDPSQVDTRNKPGAYWYVDGAKRHIWGTWLSTAPKPFIKQGAIYGYEKPPDY